MSLRAWPLGHFTITEYLKSQMENTQHNSYSELSVEKRCLYGFQVLLLCLACSSLVLLECCTGPTETGPVSPLTAICTCYFTQKHEKLAVGRPGIICPPPKSFLIIYSLERCLSPEAWCLLSVQKYIYIHFHSFNYIVTLKSLINLGIEHSKGSSHPTNMSLSMRQL